MKRVSPYRAAEIGNAILLRQNAVKTSYQRLIGSTQHVNFPVPQNRRGFRLVFARYGFKVDVVIAPSTTFLKATDRGPGGNHQAKWYVVDAEGMTVGRLATRLATILMGKHRPDYTPHVDTGDYVIVVNADKVRFSGGRMAHDEHPHYTTKMSKKSYMWFTGWPSGQRHISAIGLWEKKPTEILSLAVKRMLPKNALATHMLAKLKLFVGPNHTHQAQQPLPLPEYLMPK